MSKSILIVDDEPNVRLNHRTALETEGYAVSEAEGGDTALEALARDQFDLALLDVRMPGMDGLDLLSRMRERGHQTPAVMITAHGDVPHAVRAMKLGAIDFLQKPLTPPQLRQIVREVLERHHAAHPNMATAAIDPAISAEEQFETCLKEAKRLLNLQDFEPARDALSEAMALNPLSSDAFNLAGVLFESLGDLYRAKKYYAQSIKLDHRYEPAQQNMRRIVELIECGLSAEPLTMGEA
jgi:DNA-binding response OmpR family regulator